MKKVLLINGSNRKKNTYQLLVSIESLLKAKGFATEIITLSDYHIDFCRGCEVCVLKGKCFVRDEAHLIMEKIIACDGLVIGSPVYLNNMTGILKSFIDRTCSWFHRTEVAQIPTLLVVNTQGSGIKSTVNSIQESLIQWGVCLAGSISRNGRNFDKTIEEKELARFLKLINSNSKCYAPSLKEINTYNVQRVLARNVFPIDKVYWEEKGWMDQAYFQSARVNPIKRIYGNGIYHMLSQFIKPHK